VTRRGTTNGNVRGSNEERRRRRQWLVETYRADVDAPKPEHNAPPTNEEEAEAFFHLEEVPLGWGIPACRCYRCGVLLTEDTVTVGWGIPACRCYRCGVLLTEDTVTVDRIIPGCQGGTYRRNNIRPACGSCNSREGGRMRRSPGMST